MAFAARSSANGQCSSKGAGCGPGWEEKAGASEQGESGEGQQDCSHVCNFRTH
jgi:hypothetical protein